MKCVPKLVLSAATSTIMTRGSERALGAGRAAGAAPLARRLAAVLLVVAGAAVARTTDEWSPSYTVYVGPWTSCLQLSGETPPPPPAPQSLQRYYQDRAADKMGATSRHVGHLRDFRHLDAGRALLPARSLVHTPRLGYQRREVGCRDAAGLSTEIMNCKPLLAEVPTMQMCVLRTDCALGDWSPWRAQPGGGYTRTRSVLELPQGGGLECGLVEEVRPLLPEAGAHWAAGAWGACQVAGVTRSPDKSSVESPPEGAGEGAGEGAAEAANASRAGACGGGAQRREVTCVRADGRALHAAHCADLPSPPLQQPCEVACPRDCAVGPWGEWSACRPLGGCPMYPVQELTTAGYSVRRRRVVTAASADGAACPTLQETRACATPRCAAWVAEPWGACALSAPSRNSVAAAGERVLCGAGRRTRDLRCLDHDQKEAPRSWCSRAGGTAGAGGAAEWARGEHCRIACSGDCVLSAWGAWGACSAACAAPGGDTPTRTRRRHVLAHASPEGWACPPEHALVQREACNVHSCSTHAWLALPWSPCRPIAPRPRLPALTSPDDELQDLFGMKTSKDLGECSVAGENRREVRCVEDNERMVDDTLCAPLMKPAVRRACSLPCARACYKGPWSEWSPCPNTCEPAIQSRERAVEGGAGCGAHARQERRACAPPRSCLAPAAAPAAAAPTAWAAGTWGRCRLPPSIFCGWGLRTRGVWCSARSHRVDASLCAGGARAGLRVPPSAVQRCRVPCAADRDADHAAADALRRERCNEICLYGYEHEDSFEPTKADCNCPKFHLELLNTPSDCILPEGSSCGVGRKLHAALCIMEGINNTVLDMEICKKHVNLTGLRGVAREWSAPHAPPPPGYQHDDEFPGLLQSACAVPCPRDCAAGPWSEWGPCEQEQDSLAAFRLRTRVVLYGAENGGRECGATLQRAACTRRQSAWHAGDWEACAPREPPCGRALQNRTVKCVVVETGEETAEVECAGEGPARQAACDAPCPADCVVSQWSDWSPCEQYKSGGRRDRTRVVLRAPAPYGAPCPHLVEAEPCAARSHAWYVAPWDDCQPLGGSPCGEGTKRRIVRCLRDDGVFVDDSFCPNMTASEARVSWCYVPCGADCELSEWGAWDASACTCGVGAHFHAQFMTRHRRRVSGAAWPGRACAAREQRAPCPRTPCVRFAQLAQSVNCLIEPMSERMRSLREARACGHGVTLTETACEVYEPGDDSAAVAAAARLDVSRCGGVVPGRLYAPPPRYQTRKCKVQCTCTHEASEGGGGLGDWSAWGPCRGGVRSRARQRLVRTRLHCTEPKFVTIEWANCSEAEVRAGLAPGQGGAGREDDGWLGDTPPARDSHVTKQRLDGSMWMNISLWVAASVVLLFGTWAPYHMLSCYRHCRYGKKVDHV